MNEFFACSLWTLKGVRKVIGSSEEVHVVDALAITGDEGRASLRKVRGSWQRSVISRNVRMGKPGPSQNTFGA